MAKLSVGDKSSSFDDEKRLVLAIKELGINIGHRCGGQGKCTTCRVSILSGEPATMTEAEFQQLSDKGLLGDVRLSCQLTCSQDMEIKPHMTLETVEGWTDTGPMPEAKVEPDDTFYTRSALMNKAR